MGDAGGVGSRHVEHDDRGRTVRLAIGAAVQHQHRSLLLFRLGGLVSMDQISRLDSVQLALNAFLMLIVSFSAGIIGLACSGLYHDCDRKPEHPFGHRPFTQSLSVRQMLGLAGRREEIPGISGNRGHPVDSICFDRSALPTACSATTRSWRGTSSASLGTGAGAG